MQLRKRIDIENEREKMVFTDGGNAIIDWFNSKVIQQVKYGNLTYYKKDDIIIIFHTPGGGSRKKVINSFRVECAKKRYMAAVLNCRGCTDTKFTIQKAYNAYEIYDFKFSIENYVMKRNPRHIFICCFSMGRMHSSRYISDGCCQIFT